MIEGKKIRLRAFEGTDAAANHEFVNDPETLRGMMSGIPFPSSYADEQQWLSQQSSYTRGEYQFAVETVDGDELAGRCGIIRVDWKNRMAKLAIMIGKPYRGRGYGKEAMELLCDFCFREMNLHKLRVSVFAFNEAAVRCYLSCGFREEGRAGKGAVARRRVPRCADSVALCRRVTGKNQAYRPLFRSESVFLWRNC